MLRSLQSVPAALTVLIPSIGLLAMGVVNAFRRSIFLEKSWLWLWVVAFVLPLMASALAGRWTDAGLLLGQVSIALLACALLNTSSGERYAGLLLAVAIFVFACGLQLFALTTSWNKDINSRSFLATLQPLFAETLQAGGTRVWTVPAGTEGARLSLEVRKAPGEDWRWHRSTPAIELRRRQEFGKTFTRVEMPTGGDPYLMRSFDLGEPTAGRRFRVTIAMRSEKPIPRVGNRGIWLQVWGSGGSAGILPVKLNREWSSFTHEWQVPASATDQTVRLVLNDFDGLSFDIGQVELEEYLDGRWQPLGAVLTLDLAGQRSSEEHLLQFHPSDEWVEHELEINSLDFERESRVVARLTLEPGLRMQVRNTRLSQIAPEGAAPEPVPYRPRLKLWFGQPNLAGHTLVSATLALLAAIGSLRLGLPAIALASVGVFLTGSRAAFVGALVGFGWFLWLLTPARRRWWLIPTALAAGALFFALGGGESLGRLQFWKLENPNLTQRTEIWTVAWKGFVQHLATGIGFESGDFIQHWQETYTGNSPEVLGHAHNFWLQFASSFGLAGLVASIWLTGGLTYLSWHWARWRGLALVLPVLLMNVFDYTLIYSGVLFPLILGMNGLRDVRQE